MNLERRLLQVLLVEDSQWTVESLRELLQAMSVPINLRTVTTEKDAIDSALQVPPDVVILDLKLEQGTGFSVIRQLCAHGLKTKIAVLTNYALPKYRDLALLVGADYFLDKATDFALLPSIIESIEPFPRGGAGTIN